MGVWRKNIYQMYVLVYKLVRTVRTKERMREREEKKD